MTKKYLISLFLILLLGFFAFAQTDKATEKTVEAAKTTDTAAKTDTVKIAAPKIPKPLPFKAGESLLFDITFDKFIIRGLSEIIKIVQVASISQCIQVKNAVMRVLMYKPSDNM